MIHKLDTTTFAYVQRQQQTIKQTICITTTATATLIGYRGNLIEWKSEISQYWSFFRQRSSGISNNAMFDPYEALVASG